MRVTDAVFGETGEKAMGSQIGPDGVKVSTRVIDGDAREKKDPSFPAVVFMRNQQDGTVEHHFEVPQHNPRDRGAYFEPEDFRARINGEVYGPHSVEAEVDDYINRLRDQSMAVGVVSTESAVEIEFADQEVA